MIEDVQRELPGYAVQAIEEGNCGEMLEVLASNQAYFDLFDEGTPDARTCREIMDALPPGFDARGKVVAGFWQGGRPVALLDMLLGYPTEDSVWIGLLMVHGQRHGRGIGRTIHEAIARSARGRGYGAMQLGVIAGNAGALAFWQSLGYRMVRSVPAASPSGRETHVLTREMA